MTEFHKTDALIFHRVDADTPTWCAYEISYQDGTAPPTIIFVSACKLQEVFTIRPAMNNSEFRKIVKPGAVVGIRIFATGTNVHAIRRAAQERLEAFPSRPICNARGFRVSTPGRARPIRCSNGKTYRNQNEAALDLGVQQPTISRHLAGFAQSVAGETLWYKGEREE